MEKIIKIIIFTIMIIIIFIISHIIIIKKYVDSTARYTSLMRYCGTYIPKTKSTKLGTDEYSKYFLINHNKILKNYIINFYNGIGFSGTSYILSRNYYFDKSIVNLTKTENIKQIVIIGAGYDTRAIRFEKEYERVEKIFELDFSKIQKSKIQTIKENEWRVPSKVRYIKMKRNILWSEILINNGFDENLKTIFVMEGVSFYMKRKTFIQNIKKIKEITKNKGFMIFDYKNVNSNKDIENYYFHQFNRILLKYLFKEPLYCSFYSMEDFVNTMRNCSFEVVDVHLKNHMKMDMIELFGSSMNGIDVSDIGEFSIIKF
jgi:methyltransferase (TIGR00027 family)